MKFSAECKHGRHVCKFCQQEFHQLWLERNALEQENLGLKEELRRRKILAVVEAKP